MIIVFFVFACLYNHLPLFASLHRAVGPTGNVGETPIVVVGAVSSDDDCVLKDEGTAAAVITILVAIIVILLILVLVLLFVLHRKYRNQYKLP